MDWRRATFYIVFMVTADPVVGSGWLVHTNLLGLFRLRIVNASPLRFSIEVVVVNGPQFTLNHADLQYNRKYALAYIPRDENQQHSLVINGTEDGGILTAYPEPSFVNGVLRVGPGLNARIYEMIIAYTGRDHDNRDEVMATLAMLKTKWGAL